MLRSPLPRSRPKGSPQWGQMPEWHSFAAEPVAADAAEEEQLIAEDPSAEGAANWFDAAGRFLPEKVEAFR